MLACSEFQKDLESAGAHLYCWIVYFFKKNMFEENEVNAFGQVNRVVNANKRFILWDSCSVVVVSDGVLSVLALFKSCLEAMGIGLNV